MKFNRRDLFKVLGAWAVAVPNLSAVPEVDRLTTPPQPLQDRTPPCPSTTDLLKEFRSWKEPAYDDQVNVVWRKGDGLYSAVRWW